MRAEEMSGRQLLDEVYGPSKFGEAMAPAEKEEFREERRRDLERARRGEYLPPDQRGEGDVKLETLSAVRALHAYQVRMEMRLARLERMLEFLVARVPGPAKDQPSTEGAKS